jgi:hypothetical protein
VVALAAPAGSRYGACLWSLTLAEDLEGPVGPSGTPGTIERVGAPASVAVYNGDALG